MSLELSVRLFARVREAAGSDELCVRLPVGSRVADLRQALAAQLAAVAELTRRSAVAVNQEYASDDQPLAPGDEVALIPPVSGG